MTIADKMVEYIFFVGFPCQNGYIRIKSANLSQMLCWRCASGYCKPSLVRGGGGGGRGGRRRRRREEEEEGGGGGGGRRREEEGGGGRRREEEGGGGRRSLVYTISMRMQQTLFHDAIVRRRPTTPTSWAWPDLSVP